MSVRRLCGTSSRKNQHGGCVGSVDVTVNVKIAKVVVDSTLGSVFLTAQKMGKH